MAGLYIHIPFCKTRCIYCSFFSTTFSHLQDAYVDALLKEFEARKNEYDKGEGFTTLYLGGGTPSQLSISQLERLLANIQTLPNAERTIECNPDDITPEYATALLRLGFNRVSLGIQTFNDERLQFIHRRHNSDKAIKAVQILRQTGFNNISIDLIYGFPNQSLTEWNTDVEKAILLNVQHISSYCLSYEEGTILEKMKQSGEVMAVDDETLAEMYNLLCSKLVNAGYEHYEISNFALPHYYSRHNSSYWHGQPYLGIGAGAHSYNGKQRSWNNTDLQVYIKNMKNFQPIIHNSELMEELSATDKYNELIMTRLRTARGINTDEIPEPFRQYFDNKIQNYLGNGVIEYKDNHYRLTRQALFISDAIISDLFK